MDGLKRSSRRQLIVFTLAFYHIPELAVLFDADWRVMLNCHRLEIDPLKLANRRAFDS